MEKRRRGEGDTVKLPLDRIFMARRTEIDRADEHAAPSLGQIDSHPVFESCHVCWEGLLLKTWKICNVQGSRIRHFLRGQPYFVTIVEVQKYLLQISPKPS